MTADVPSGIVIPASSSLPPRRDIPMASDADRPNSTLRAVAIMQYLSEVAIASKS